ncbi:class I SAM-dependent methyltransferase [Aquifex aeolicus]|uniref:O-methyltransferase n=1 Tax=Aquifex aeolicus (strain VF5) TaxID=224324 RepID=O67476_AQUAE|nr:class I SAM-dependent methyltransferase [Aquifex aeolicus]AAC07435.1 O-methyltransferase [Aquifex aeolicus VF5]
MAFICPEEIEAYAEEHSSELHPILEELVEFTYKNTDLPQMMVGRAEGNFLKMLVEISGAKRVLEIGTFTGFSALMMAQGLPEDGKLTTIEVNPEYAQMAKSFIERAPWGKKIEVIVGDARKVLEEFKKESFDFIFIDADKSSYPYYYEKCLELLKKGRLMAIDNALWEGKVLEPDDNRSKAIARMNEMIKEDPRVEKVLLTVRDGIFLVRKI